MKLQSARDDHMTITYVSCNSTWNRAEFSAIADGAKVYITAS